MASADNKAAARSSATQKRNAAHAKYKRAWDVYARSKTPANKRKLLKAKDKYEYWVDALAELNKKSKFERADNYRAQFLKENPGILFGHYMCIYCFRIISKEHMQVDHLVAVNRLQKNPLWKLMFMFSKDGVNTTMNLYPACPHCNNRKKDKGGMWIVRGNIGGVLWRVLQGLQKLLHKLFSSKVFVCLLIGLGVLLVLNLWTAGGLAFGSGPIFEIIRSIFQSIL